MPSLYNELKQAAAASVGATASNFTVESLMQAMKKANDRDVSKGVWTSGITKDFDWEKSNTFLTDQFSNHYHVGKVGGLTRNELAKFANDIGGLNDGFLDKLFSTYDKDKSNDLSVFEQDDAWKDLKAGKGIFNDSYSNVSGSATYTEPKPEENTDTGSGGSTDSGSGGSTDSGSGGSTDSGSTSGGSTDSGSTTTITSCNGAIDWYNACIREQNACNTMPTSTITQWNAYVECWNGASAKKKPAIDYLTAYCGYTFS